MQRAGTALLLLVTCAACASDEPVQPVVVRDSAGVEIVENRSPTAGGIGIDLVEREPSLNLGLEDGPAEYLFARVRSVTRFADGRIVVANAGSGEIRVFSADGRHLQSLGSLGDGPGEFRALDQLWTVEPDTIIATDAALNRVTVLSLSGGGAVATHPVPRIETATPSSTWIAGRFADGSFLLKAVPHLPPDAREGKHETAAEYARIRPGGGESEPLGAFFEAQSWVVREGAGLGSYTVPFAPRGYAIAHGAGFFVADGSRYRVEWRDTTGHLRRVIVAPEARRPVRPEDLDFYRHTFLDGATGAERSRLERVIGSIEPPRHHPVLGQLVAGADGGMWIHQPLEADRDGAIWNVFRSDGRWVTNARVPPDYSILWVDSAGVIGLWRDPDSHVEYIRGYSFPPLTGGGGV